MSLKLIEDNEYEYDNIKVIINEQIYLEAKRRLDKNPHQIYHIPNNQEIIISKENNDYKIKSIINNEVKDHIIPNPKTIYFKKGNLKYSSYIINSKKINELIKKYNLKNIHFKKNNKSYSLIRDSFINSPGINEIYESFSTPSLTEKEFNNCFIPKNNSIIAPELEAQPELNEILIDRMNLNAYSYHTNLNFPFTKKLNTETIYYIYPEYFLNKDNDNDNDFAKLRRTIYYMSTKTFINPEDKKLSIPTLFIAGGIGIGKTLSILYLTKSRANKIYFNLENFTDNFQNTLNIFFKESIFAFSSGNHSKYISFQKSIMNEVDLIDNNIFCLLCLFIKYFECNNNTNLRLFIIIDNYKKIKDPENNLERLIKEVEKNDNYRIIITYSLDDIDNRKEVLKKFLNKEKNFLFLNNLKGNYKDFKFEDKRINEVLKEFNYLPYYYFNYIDYYLNDKNSSKDIIKNIKNDLFQTLKNIQQISHTLFLIPCINEFNDDDSKITFLSKAPLKFFKIQINNNFGLNKKIKIDYLNNTIKEICEDLIEETISKLLINNYNKILNYKGLQGIAYEIYLVKKIINSKKIGNFELEVKCIEEISSFDFNEELNNEKNYLFYQSDYYGVNYDILFLINNRLIIVQVSISKNLDKMKTVLFAFQKDALRIKKKVEHNGYIINSSEIFFIFSPDSKSINKCNKYSIPFIIFNPLNNKLISNKDNEINGFPKTEISKYSYIKKLNFIFKYFNLKKNIINKFNVTTSLKLPTEDKIYQYNNKKFIINFIIELNNYKVNFNELINNKEISFVVENEYIIIPKINEFKIYIINKDNNILTEIKEQEEKKNILDFEYEKIILSKIKIEKKETNSDYKLLKDKRKRDKKFQLE